MRASGGGCMLNAMQFSRRSFGLVPSLALAVTLSAGLVACSGGAQEAPPATAQTAQSLAPVGASTHGAVRMVGQALGEVPLRPDQRAELEKLATQAEERHVKVHEQAKALMLAFADQVEKGQIDRAALKPKIDATIAAFEASRPADRAALERTHAILDPSQRDKFVEALKAKMKEHHGHHGGDHAKGEHAKGEHEAKADHEGKPEQHAMWGHGGIFQLGRQLNLSDDQKDKIKDAFKDMHAQHKAAAGGADAPHHGPPAGMPHREMGKVLEAFKGDKFSMDQVAPPVDVKARAQVGSDRILGVSEKIVPILTPEQRAVVAKMIRDKANHADASILTR